MTSEQFSKLLKQLQIYLICTEEHHFFVTLHKPSRLRRKHYGIFQFNKEALRAMTEQQAIEYIKKCKESMKREIERMAS